MKLKKNDLIKALRPGFETLGYHFFKDSITGAQGLFGKKVSDDMYLQVALNIHRFYEDAFTVDLCFTNATHLFDDREDIPIGCNVRPGQLLSTKERIKYYQANVCDYWWSLYNEDIRPAFFDMLSLVEHRLINNSQLVSAIRESIRLKSEVLCEQWVIECFFHKQFASDIKYTPGTPKDNIPLDWFRAAETLLLTLIEETSFTKVCSLASESFRRYTLDSIYGA